jgi:spoIIIJ-associated protein
VRSRERWTAVSDDQQTFQGRDLTEALAAARKHFQLARRDIEFEVVRRPDLGPIDDEEHGIVEIRAWARSGATPGSYEAPPEPEEAEERRPPRRRERRRGDEGGGGGRHRERGRRRERPRGEESAESAGALEELPDLLPAKDAEVSSEQVVRHLTGSLVTGLDLELEVEEVEHNPMGLRVKLAGRDTDRLLEEKAEGLEMLQYLANRLLHRDGRVEERVSFDADGYRERREQELIEQARQLCEEVRETGEPRKMPSMGAYERRLVHLTLMDEPGIRSYSTGSGGRRRLQIAPADAEESGGDEA